MQSRWDRGSNLFYRHGFFRRSGERPRRRRGAEAKQRCLLLVTNMKHWLQIEKENPKQSVKNLLIKVLHV